MATLDFPSNPNNGDTYVYNGVTYIYDSTDGKWTVTSTSTANVNLAAVETHIVPASNVTYDLGSSTNAFRDLYLSGSSINLGGQTITSDNDGVVLPEGSKVGSISIGAGGATVYANTSILPTTNLTAGSFAFVGNTLFITNGTGWYSVGVTNQSPTLSLSTSGITLGASGNTINFTFTATDPDGPAPTVTATTTANSSQANVTLYTSNNTVTVENLSADPYSANIVLSATDGVNQTYGTVTLTVSFLSELWDETVLSVGTSSTNGLDNLTFIDRSTNGHTVLMSQGSPSQNSFHPYLDKWSTRFNSGQYIQFATANPFTITTGPFTLEAWVKRDSDSAMTIICENANWGSGDNAGYRFGINADMSLYFVGSQGVWNSFPPPISGTQTSVGNTGQWNHYAITRDSNDLLTYWINGVSVLSGTYAGSFDQVGDNDGTLQTKTPRVARLIADGTTYNPLVGNISNLRISTVARYTQEFDPREQDYSADGNTQCLMFHKNRFEIEGTTTATFSFTGTPSVSASNPFGQGSEYAVGENKGSSYFNNYRLSVANGTDFDFSGGVNFTLEAWIYRTGDNGQYAEWIIGKRATGSPYPFSWYIGVGADNKFFLSDNANNVRSTTVFTLNQWYHVAATMESGTARIFVNGVLEASSTSLSISEVDVPVTIGNYPIDTPEFIGYISDLRVIRGVAQYTTTFVPPTAPVGNTNASFYLPFDNAGMYDKTGNHMLSTTWDAATSTTQTKFADTSIYFDGTGDSVVFSDNTIGNLPTDFTMEGWFNFSALSTNRMLIDNWTNGVSGSWQLYWRATGTAIAFYENDTQLILQDPSGSTITTGTWYHIALCRSGSTLRLFIDGNEKASATFSTALTPNTQTALGKQNSTASNYFHGYMENVQILKGVAKYTTNFTPPGETQGREYQATS